VVVRYFADGPVRIADGDRIEFQLGLLHGEFLSSEVNPVVEVRVPENHLGGTFVETPGRIGPWRSDDGSLYFIMEPTETDNRFMMVKSTDGGKSWREADGGNRPPARDLEAVDAVRIGDYIHIVHMEDVVWYHAFRMASAGSQAEGWVTRSQLIAEPEKPPVQSVGIEVLDDGSKLVFHADGTAITIRSRLDDGSWAFVARVKSSAFNSGIQVVQDNTGGIYLVYTDGSGNAWLQPCGLDGPSGKRLLLSSGMGDSEADAGSILRPVFLPQDHAVAVVYRERDGCLHERRLDTVSGVLSNPVRIMDSPVIQNAVDSDQTGADLVAHMGGLHLFFIEGQSRSLFYTRSVASGAWSNPVPLIEGIQGSWIRANGLGEEGIGFVYDAGSKGGSGMNRFGKVPVSGD
jgi:hypothetical protein